MSNRLTTRPVALDRKMPWPTRVSIVFDARPRIAGRESAVWMDRLQEQDKLSFRIPLQGDHIVVDGPTGTGKTSLTLTALSQATTPFVMVTVVKDLDWPRFCAEALYTSDEDSGPKATGTLGLERGLPTLSLKLESAAKTRSSSVPAARAEWAKSVDEHLFASLLQRENAALVVDDAEEASAELLSKLANVAKLLTTDMNTPKNAKLIFVGTGDVYARLLTAKPQLQSRIYEVSLGTLPQKSRGWDFLRQGFDVLGSRHPGSDGTSRADMEGVVRSVYDAADGLPKSLNELGKAVCQDSKGHQITAPALVKIAATQTRRNWLECFQRAKEVVEGLRTFAVARDVFKCLGAAGIGTIHDCEEVHERLDGNIGFDQVELGLDKLVALKFLTRTGPNRSVAFVNDPALAHSLEVVSKNPSAFRHAERVFSKGAGQLDLGFGE